MVAAVASIKLIKREEINQCGPQRRNALQWTILRPRPHVSGDFRIRNFFFPDTATVHTHPASSTANPEKNKSATNLITCGRVNPDIFESDDVKSVSSLSPNNKPIWRRNVSSEHPATIPHYGACSEDILAQRSLGY